MTAGVVASNTEAYSQIAAAVRAVAEGDDMVSLMGSPLRLDYGPVLYQAVPDLAKPLLRLVMNASGEYARSLGTPTYCTKQGNVDIQLIFATSFPNAPKLGRMAADLLVKVVQKRAGDVDFYRSFIRDMPADERFVAWRIQAQYRYDIMEG